MSLSSLDSMVSCSNLHRKKTDVNYDFYESYDYDALRYRKEYRYSREPESDRARSGTYLKYPQCL